MKTYYFYTLHEFQYPKDNIDSELEYVESIKKGITNIDAHLLMLANSIRDSQRRIDEKFCLDNGHDARYFRYTGAIKQVSEESYYRIVEDEKSILARKSDKSKALMKEYNINGWHKPFKIEATDAEDFWWKLNNIFGFKPAIEISSTVENPVLY